MNPARKILLLGVVLALAGSGFYAWHTARPGNDGQKYRLESVSRGDIVQTISANGTLNPVVLVNVGTQVSGTVKALHADFNAKVAAGQVLAELDPALLQAQVRQNRANVANAESALNLAITKVERNRILVEKQFISRTTLDESEQMLEAARAQLALARAALAKDETNLGYSVIRSPISGVVVARNVDLGQTVAASFQTPTLFQIARDLREMQIDTSVAEADIGSIRVGMPVRFTVDAFGERPFTGKVRQIRLNPSIQQNVVTYNVVVAVENRDETLLPGMTAHIQIAVDRRDQVLRVPNAALRFRPKSNGNDAGRPVSRAPSGDGKPPVSVYRLENGSPAQVKIRTGISDGAFTEALDGGLSEGDQLIVKELGKSRESGGGNFKPRLF